MILFLIFLKWFAIGFIITHIFCKIFNSDYSNNKIYQHHKYLEFLHSKLYQDLTMDYIQREQNILLEMEKTKRDYEKLKFKR